MKALSISLDRNSSKSLYIQLYEYFKEAIMEGEISAGEKLPSLRSLSKSLGISITSTQTAYSQLLIEGYVISKAQSGFYAAEVKGGSKVQNEIEKQIIFDNFVLTEPPYRYDLNSFNFNKWKKCMNTVLSNYSSALLFEGDRQGELVLRNEISKYIYESRGVTCTPEQVVISAGTQQLMNRLARILKRLNIEMIAAEDPGYTPVQKIFRDNGFAINKIPMAENGIRIEKLPEKLSSAVYVIPSNQFPTGAVMPVGRRYQLLDWANENNSYIIEDDYDSELRYFGRPIPSLQSLDKKACVVYLGSFSSTLFSAIRLSYMVLPMPMLEIFNEIKDAYDQTSSKLEQLTLATYMQKGDYRRQLRKLRSLYSRKLDAVLDAVKKHGGDMIAPVNTKSGINITLMLKGNFEESKISDIAQELKIHMITLPELSSKNSTALCLYYSQIPLNEIESVVSGIASSLF